MATLNGSPPTQQRVPAWKRIGLKLKYAKEHAPDTSHAPGHTVSAVAVVPRKHGDEASQHDSGRATKRRKTSRDSPNGTPPAASNTRPPSPLLTRPVSPDEEIIEPTTDPVPRPRVGNTDELPSRHAGDSQTRPRRKSVTFTPETKQEDGFGASAALRKPSAQPEVYKSVDASIAATDVESEPKSRQSTRPEQTQPSSAKPKPTKPKDTHASHAVPRYVTYLQLYRQDRASWKFNKKLQNDLLKNLFDINRLPPQHNEALLEYVGGLQGSQARQRVIDSSETILREIADNDSEQHVDVSMESEEARRSAYSGALQRHLKRCAQAGFQRNEYDDQQLEEMRHKAEQGQRAEAMLGQLLEKELYPSQQSVEPDGATPTSTQKSSTIKVSTASTPATPTSRSKPDSKRKKRKSRTQASSSDSSDSSSSSDSDSDSESDSEAPPKKAISINTTAPPPAARQKNKNHKIFDDDLLDQMFPKKPSYHESAPKRKANESSKKAKSFAHTHGTKADESGSEDE